MTLSETPSCELRVVVRPMTVRSEIVNGTSQSIQVVDQFVEQQHRGERPDRAKYESRDAQAAADSIFAMLEALMAGPQFTIALPQKLNLDSDTFLTCDFGLTMDVDRAVSPHSMNSERSLDRSFGEHDDVPLGDETEPDFVVTCDGMVLRKKEHEVV